MSTKELMEIKDRRVQSRVSEEVTNNTICLLYIDGMHYDILIRSPPVDVGNYGSAKEKKKGCTTDGCTSSKHYKCGHCVSCCAKSKYAVARDQNHHASPTDALPRNTTNTAIAYLVV